MQHSFVVIPALPDDINGMEFRLNVKPLRENPKLQEVQFEETTVTFQS